MQDEDLQKKEIMQEEVEVGQINVDIDEPSVLVQEECRICKDFVSTISDITLGCKCKALLLAHEILSNRFIINLFSIRFIICLFIRCHTRQLFSALYSYAFGR